MSELAVITEPADAGEITLDAPVAGQAAEGSPAVALADLLVEEVSIDGMCGVY